MVRRIPGSRRLPDVATVSRTLDRQDKKAVTALRRLSRSLVLQRLHALSPARLTLDCDGSAPGSPHGRGRGGRVQHKEECDESR